MIHAIEYRPRRGQHTGELYVPHRYDNHYVVSKTRFASDYVKVSTLQEVQEYLRRGYGVRMSGKGGKGSPSLVKAYSLTITG